MNHEWGSAPAWRIVSIPQDPGRSHAALVSPVDGRTDVQLLCGSPLAAAAPAPGWRKNEDPRRLRRPVGQHRPSE